MTTPLDARKTISGREPMPQQQQQHAPGRSWMHPTVNITSPERIGRIVLGLLGAVVGVVLLATAGGGGLAHVLEGLLVLAGLDLVVTGALGHCPLYARLGHVPSSLRPPV